MNSVLFFFLYSHAGIHINSNDSKETEIDKASEITRSKVKLRTAHVINIQKARRIGVPRFTLLLKTFLL